MALQREKPTVKDKVSNWLTTLDPIKRKRLTLIGGGLVIFLLATLIITASPDDQPRAFTKPRKVEYSLFQGQNPREVSMDAMASNVKRLMTDFGNLRSTFQRQEQKINLATEELKKLSDEVKRKSEELDQKAQDIYQKLEASAHSPVNEVPLPPIGWEDAKSKPRVPKQLPTLIGEQTATSPKEVEQALSTGPKIRVVTVSGEQTQAKPSDKPEAPSQTQQSQRQDAKKIHEFINIKSGSKDTGPDIFLPAGSILSGTLISGLDAPTANQSRQDPFPALLRIKHEAILPNRYRMDIRECFVIASGFGDLSAERAYMRAERISCIKKDGSVIENALDAYSVGEDGKAGVRGRLVSKNGQIIANALLSGFVSGISQAFAPQRVQSFQTGLVPGDRQVFQYPSPEMLAGQAVMGGVKGAAEQIADYYLDMAKNIFPIVEIDAGRAIDFVVIRGVALQSKSKRQVSEALPSHRPYSESGPSTYPPSGRHLGNLLGANLGLGGGYGAERYTHNSNFRGFYE